MGCHPKHQRKELPPPSAILMAKSRVRWLIENETALKMPSAARKIAVAFTLVVIERKEWLNLVVLVLSFSAPDQ
jgi:hypothetical protein